MAHHCTVLSQLLRLIPRHEFESAARRHHRGRKLRAIRRWDQFVALVVTQLTGRSSLRDVVANLWAQVHKLYHVGAKPVSRTSLARVNQTQPAELFQEIFYKLLERTRKQAPRHAFRFKGRLISLDASFIAMTASVFPWAEYKSTKGALKLHVGLDHSGYLPAFVAVTDGLEPDSAWAKSLNLPKASVVVFDRGYLDYEFFKQLSHKKIRFVTRFRRDLGYRTLERHEVDRASGLTSDHVIQMQGRSNLILRRIGYRDPESGKQLFFLTNDLELPAETVAQIYRERWQIELFFKWIKQNLKIQTFLGTTRNAVLSQIWVALTVYLLLAYLKYSAALKASMSQILRLLQLNLFARRALWGLLDPKKKRPPSHEPQLCLPIT